MNLKAIDHIVDLSLEEMVVALADARAALRAQEELVWYIERAAIEGMRERGATVVKTEAGQARLVTPVSYDYSRLAQLREITGPDDLVGYTAEHEVTRVVPESWNMTKAKPLARLSSAHAEVIEAAKIPGAPRITIDAP
jgi:hypothetical protein